MNVSDLKQSKFLKRSDCGQGIRVTIASIVEMNVAPENQTPEMKCCVNFHETDKPLVLNSTNGQIIAQITGIDSDIEKNWVGKQIVLYDDPNVSFAGKLTGGIRVRAVRTTKQGAATEPIYPVDTDGSQSLPF
jgi:hypothetical protein